jgi:GNAT superfamily N-acetyltransferase
MTNPFDVRSAHPHDAAILLRLLVSAFGEYEGKLDPPSGANAETVESIAHKLAEGGAFICAERDVPIGCVFYAPKPDHLYVGRLSVMPEHRKRGIGDLLLAATERQAAALRLPCIRIGVRIVLEPLHAYYTARGYVSIGLRSHDGYAHPTFIEMEKKLS